MHKRWMYYLFIRVVKNNSIHGLVINSKKKENQYICQFFRGTDNNGI